MARPRNPGEDAKPVENAPIVSPKENGPILDSVEQTLEALRADIISSRSELETQNRYNALRAEIWQMAFDGVHQESNLITELLSKIGAFFKVARASYYEINPDQDKAICAFQWCSPGIEGTVGFSIPQQIWGTFQGKESVSLTSQSLPPGTLGDELRALFSQGGVSSFLAVFHPDPHNPTGFFSFTHLEPHHCWTELETGIIVEVVRIVSLKTVNATAQEELRLARDRLERQVKRRTTELHGIIERLRQDITAKKQTEEKLRAREQFLSNVFESIQDGICILDSDLNIVRTNATMERWYAHKMPLAGKKCFFAFHGRTTPCEICPTREAFSLKKSVSRIIPRTGEDRRMSGWVDVHAFPFVDNATGEVSGVIEYVRDITDRQEAERLLAEEKELLDVTLRSIGDAVISTDSHGTILTMNSVAERMTGYKLAEAVGQPLERVVHLVDERTRKRCDSLVKRVVEKGVAASSAERILVGRDGAEFPISDNAAPIRDRAGETVGVVVVFRDVSTQQKLERELFKARKLESVTVLAGGIAHDFNNVLTGIVTNLFMAKMSPSLDDETRSLLIDAEKAAFRASHLTRQLLTFSRGTSLVKEHTSIRELIEDSVGFCLSGSMVDYRLEIADDLWSAQVDRGQIDQVLNNLIINADQAMPDGGTVVVRAENVTIGDSVSEDTEEILPLPPGMYVKVSVIDQGIGIPSKDLERIFDPYFTSKPSGAGLGLTTAYSIVKKHGGYLTAKSRLGEGATFVFYLPALASETNGNAGSGDEIGITGAGKILVMDDDDVVRSVVQKLLTRNGYEVRLAVHGQEALDIYSEEMRAGAPFDAVIMDLTVPDGLGGKEATRLLLEMDPHAKVIVFSGYSNDAVFSDAEGFGFSGVIAKPFNVHEFSTVLARVLTAPRRGDAGQSADQGAVSPA